MSNSILDYIEKNGDMEQYNEIIARATEAKANAPKKVRGPLTAEQKIKRDEKQLEKLKARLAALQAEQAE